MTTIAHWADVIELRPEVVARRGHAEGLQMSLYDAVYQTSDVPYRDAVYWCDITEPTTRLTEFLAEIWRQLSGASIEGQLFAGGDSLFHLDQGMGGGKSHALVGAWHMAHDPTAFFASDVGVRVRDVAERRAGGSLSVRDIRAVVLCADRFSPGVARPEFGPATNLHQRFLWSLFAGNRALYDHHVVAGTDKAALKDALASVGQPVLILLDEIMDYAMALAGPDFRDTLPSEQAFLNSLTGVVNEVPGAVMVTVMIRSDLDEQGYEGPAADFRSYLARRLERNGTTVSVNEPQDFGAIIRRRIFARPAASTNGNISEIATLGQAWADAASSAWKEHVFERLPGARQLSGFTERLRRSYPFHPDLLDLVEHDWTQHAGFQRVRSTVEVFAASAFFWASQRANERWAPELIGLGDIPLHTAVDEVLSSGLLHGNERQVVGMRQVAEKDVTSADRTDGQAVLADQRLSDGRGWIDIQPQPAVRFATALWMYSVAVRAQGRRGATKAELLAAIYVPDAHFTYADADEVFNALTDDEDERGLGALDVIQGSGGGTPARYLVVTQLNKRIFHRGALQRTSPEDSYGLVWERVKCLAAKGSGFDALHFIERPDPNAAKPLKEIFAEVDQRRSNRLVVLDPRRWTLLNGRDSATRSDIEALLGRNSDEMTVDFGASCVVACVNTQRRDTMVKRARAAYAWRLAASEIDKQLDLYTEMADEATRAIAQVDSEIRRAYQHYVYLVRDDDDLHAEFIRFEDDAQTSLSGNDVWEKMASRGDAVRSVQGLAGSYLHHLLDLSARNYTLAEVVEKFWRDPSFPIIPNDSVARRAIFDALRPDDDGVAWELVTSAGQPLHVATPEQLALNSSDQYVRLAQPQTADLAGTAPTPATSGPGAVMAPAAGGRPIGRQSGSSSGPVQYEIHQLTMVNRSLADRDVREKVFQLLTELADALDPTSGADIQVATVRIEVNAAKGALDQVAPKATAAGASWDTKPEEF
jgi:hypothetical protein